MPNTNQQPMSCEAIKECVQKYFNSKDSNWQSNFKKKKKGIIERLHGEDNNEAISAANRLGRFMFHPDKNQRNQALESAFKEFANLEGQEKLDVMKAVLSKPVAQQRAAKKEKPASSQGDGGQRTAKQRRSKHRPSNKSDSSQKGTDSAAKQSRKPKAASATQERRMPAASFVPLDPDFGKKEPNRGNLGEVFPQEESKAEFNPFYSPSGVSDAASSRARSSTRREQESSLSLYEEAPEVQNYSALFIVACVISVVGIGFLIYLAVFHESSSEDAQHVDKNTQADDWFSADFNTPDEPTGPSLASWFSARDESSSLFSSRKMNRGGLMGAMKATEGNARRAEKGQDNRPGQRRS